jgi:flagellar biosynthesis chaperone FliJ
MSPEIPTKISLKEQIMEKDTENLIEKIPDMVNQKVQDALKKFQDTINEECEKTQKQINGLRGEYNKHQSKTKDTIKREICAIKKSPQNIKQELHKDVNKPQKKESNRDPGNKKFL